MTANFWQRSIEVEVRVSQQHFRDFALLTGDDAAHHLDENVAREMGYKTTLGQGLLVLSFSGKASSEYLRIISRNGVSYGYDKLRFPSPVYQGQILTISYEPQEINEKNVVRSSLTVTTSEGGIALAGHHLLKLSI